jgi:hypothetical protein
VLKRILLLIITLFLNPFVFAQDSSGLDEMLCLSEKSETAFVIPETYVTTFDINNCTDLEIKKDLIYYLSEFSGNQFAGIEMQDSNIDEVVQFLLMNFENKGGSKENTKNDIQNVLDYYYSTEPNTKLKKVTYLENLKDSKQRTLGLILLFDSKKQELTMIKKTMTTN